MSDFLSMSGYAAYVWPSVGLTIALLVFHIVQARRLHAQARAEARRRLASGSEA